MKSMFRLLFLALLAVSLAPPLQAARSYTIGMIPKSQGNPFFEASRVGANDAARDLSKKHGIKIKIDWRGPNQEDSQRQAEIIEQLENGDPGIFVGGGEARSEISIVMVTVQDGEEIVIADRLNEILRSE